MTNTAKHMPLHLISGKECPSCGRDNSADGEFCNFEECPGVMIYDAAPELLTLLKEINYAFYVSGKRNAMMEVMAKTKPLIAKAEGK